MPLAKVVENISDLIDIMPEYANIEVGNTLEQVDPEDVEVGTGDNSFSLVRRFLSTVWL